MKRVRTDAELDSALQGKPARLPVFLDWHKEKDAVIVAEQKGIKVSFWDGCVIGNIETLVTRKEDIE